jgi:glucokinase
MLLGIEIGGTKLQLVLGTADGVIAHRERCIVDKNRGSEGIREQICAAIPKLTSTTIIEAVGVGFGGPVNWRHGKVCCSHQIKGWADFDLGAWLNDVTSAPVRVENDANTGCLGEALLGAGKGRNPVFYVTLGSGVGGGLVANGSVYHGATPAEAEIAMFASLATEPLSKTAAPAGPSIAASKKPFKTILENSPIFAKPPPAVKPAISPRP